jgi:hypothetical protein
MAAPQFKAVLIATPQMRSESGLTFRSKQSAVWPADPRGRRGGREPAGKTCYLPRFDIMDRILSPFRRDGQASGRIVGNPDITPTFEFCPVGGHSPETRTVGVFLFGLVNERIGGDLASTEITRHTSGLPSTCAVHTASRLRRTAPGRRTLSVVFLMP